MNMDVTLEQIKERLDKIEELTLIGAKSVLNLEETVRLTGLSKGQLYRLTSNRKIPHYKLNRKLFFRKSEVEEWLLSNRVQTKEEINNKAATYIVLKNK